LTTRAVAELLRLSPETVLRRWRAGELPGYRLGSNVLRFDRRDVDDWLKARRRGSAS
jgi:excisionase family DNA binding protein